MHWKRIRVCEWDYGRIYIIARISSSQKGPSICFRASVATLAHVHCTDRQSESHYYCITAESDPYLDCDIIIFQFDAVVWCYLPVVFPLPVCFEVVPRTAQYFHINSTCALYTHINSFHPCETEKKIPVKSLYTRIYGSLDSSCIWRARNFFADCFFGVCEYACVLDGRMRCIQ